MTTPTLLQAIRELAQEHIQFVDDACLAFHAGGDTRLAKHALRLVEIVELYQTALEYYAQSPEPDITSTFAKSAAEWGQPVCTWEPLLDLGQNARQALLAADKVASRE